MRMISLRDVAALLRPGLNVFVQGCASEPADVLAALAGDDHASRGVHYTGVFVPGVNRADPAGFGEKASWTGFFATRETAASLRAGRARVLPLGYSGILHRLLAGPPIDIALIQVAPPDAAGRCSLGPSVDFVPAVLTREPLVVAEINTALPALPGSPAVPLERIDYALHVDHPLAELQRPDPSAAVSAAARAAAALIGDGATLQVGLGRLPEAVLGELGERNDIGLHSGMITPSAIDLIDRGVINGERKSLDRGKAIAGVALGDNRFYQRLADVPNLLFRPADYTHNPSILEQQERLVAVNGAIEVDLFGQVNAELLSGRLVSGIGGLVDFQRGARLAPGGRAVTVLTATDLAGGASRIVPSVRLTTVGRDEIDYVVTEYGVAALRDAGPEERADALIAIAAPDFRDELRAAWRCLRPR